MLTVRERERVKSLVFVHRTSKRIELEGPGCSGFKASFKTWAIETFSLNSFRSYTRTNTNIHFAISDKKTDVTAKAKFAVFDFNLQHLLKEWS